MAVNICIILIRLYSFAKFCNRRRGESDEPLSNYDDYRNVLLKCYSNNTTIYLLTSRHDARKHSQLLLVLVYRFQRCFGDQ